MTQNSLAPATTLYVQPYRVCARLRAQYITICGLPTRRIWCMALTHSQRRGRCAVAAWEEPFALWAHAPPAPSQSASRRTHCLSVVTPIAIDGLPYSSGGFSTTTDSVAGGLLGADEPRIEDASTGVTASQTAHFTDWAPYAYLHKPAPLLSQNSTEVSHTHATPAAQWRCHTLGGVEAQHRCASEISLFNGQFAAK